VRVIGTGTGRPPYFVSSDEALWPESRLIVGFTIPGQCAALAQLVQALDRLAGYGHGARFVPGHRPICGVEVVREFADLIDDLHDHSEKMIRVGARVEEAARRYTVPPRFENSKCHPGIGPLAEPCPITAPSRSYNRLTCSVIGITCRRGRRSRVAITVLY
jgi:hypothetical protein